MKRSGSRYEDSPVIAESETHEKGGTIRRVRVLKTDFKYPLIRVEEALERDEATGREEATVLSEMVADHVLVRLKPGVTEEDLAAMNARHGTTSVLKLAHLAELHGANIEFNGPGGLFGLVHTHLVCAIRNTSYYEYIPNGSRDEVGKEFGLLNPPLPEEGHIAPPTSPGWGAEWDWEYFAGKRMAEL